MSIEKRDKLNVAILGGGKMGRRHADAIKTSEAALIAAVADPFETEENLRTKFPEPIRIFSDPAELLASIRPDVVHITAPPALHAKLSLLALNFGAHLYVEKPFSLNLADAARVVGTAAEKGLKICAGHQLLYDPAVREMKESMSRIGKLVHVESYFSFRQVRKNLSPSEQLMDILPHPAYLLIEALRRGGAEKLEIKDICVDPAGEARAVVRSGAVMGILIVSLQGRPIESYLRVVGANGSLSTDFVHGTVNALIGPGASAASIILNPYIQAKQTLFKTTRSFAGQLLKNHRGYAGLDELIHAFYRSVVKGLPSPIAPRSILDAVYVCEEIGKELASAEEESERLHEKEYRSTFEAQRDRFRDRQIMVTGGTGFLGKRVVSELTSNGCGVRVVARRLPPFRERTAGAVYVSADLGNSVSAGLFEGIDAIVHCAAETSGGLDAHERNSVAATRCVIRQAAEAGVKKMVLISSLAVLKPAGRRRDRLGENSPVDYGNLRRGPYVWGKAESERVARLAKDSGIEVKIIRPGPLVDFQAFSAPGRLGREVGPFFVAVGPKKGPLPICDVSTAAKVVRFYVDHFENAPTILNLVEPAVPTRLSLLKRLLTHRPDLKPLWVPGAALKAISPVMTFIQRAALQVKQPIDIQAAFASEAYDTRLAARVVEAAGNGKGGNAA